MEIDKKLHDEIREYCKYNNIKIGGYINSLLRKAFNEDRYGTMPFPLFEKETEEIKPEIQEKKVEVKEENYFNEVPYPIKEEIVVKAAEEKQEIKEKEEIKEVKPKKVVRKLK